MSFQTLNKLKWTGKLGRCKIIIEDRKESAGRKAIVGDAVTELRKTYLLYRSERGETFIPLHRVTEILCDGKVLWKMARISKQL